MFATNPFAEISGSIPPAVMQTYVVIMIVLVAAGTLFDVVHKGSAKYFFDNWRKSRSKGSQQADVVSIAVKTAVVDVLASGERLLIRITDQYFSTNLSALELEIGRAHV